ncbi:hypothetical protein [Streptomyces sp. AS02]|uniref:hypothetical protein n=1 Tax=Streptomyces sp. AS02 TaxID=2938946 RepID=UPI00201FDC28|nr:hypothetical protein [Streptomyces sp. AS02]MCL8013596.1 hypothetical protein [Streptomyces sp. AS02]
MPTKRPETRLMPYARLPRRYHDRHIAHSTVDAYGRAHWLLTEDDPGGVPAHPYDAVVVTVGDGVPYETHLSAVLAGFPRLEALADGGFVLAAARSRTHEQQVQVFDPLGRCGVTFRVGDAIEHLLADESGDLWVGYFDEGIYGDDELSRPGLRRWSLSGEPLWTYRRAQDAGEISDCYALNVHRRTVWACPYQRFPVLEIGRDGGMRVRQNSVQGAKGFVVHADRLVFFGGYGADHDRLVDCRLTEQTVETLTEGRLSRPDGGALGRRRVVSRGPRLYIQEEPGLEWTVLDIS